MIGSYVPAVQAYIGDFDRIYTRLNSDESIR
jgi:DNA mismatch repair ATPase MutS